MTNAYNDLKVSGATAARAGECMQQAGILPAASAGEIVTEASILTNGKVEVIEKSQHTGKMTSVTSHFAPADRDHYPRSKTREVEASGSAAERDRRVAARCIRDSIKP